MIKSDIDADKFFQGEDKTLPIQVFAADNTTPIDIGGWSLSYVLQKTSKSSTPLIRKTTGPSPGGISIIGAFNADPLLNTQKVIITFTDLETNELTAKKYWHELKRMDGDVETVLMNGDFNLSQSARIHRDA